MLVNACHNGKIIALIQSLKEVILLLKSNEEREKEKGLLEKAFAKLLELNCPEYSRSRSLQ